MKLEDQVVSLELAKKLKSLNVEQESYFEWVQHAPHIGSGEIWNVFRVDKDDVVNEKYSAFTVAELGEMLPHRINYRKDGDDWSGQCDLEITKGAKTFTVSYITYGYGTKKILEKDTNFSNALAKMLVYLLEQGIIKKNA